MRGTAPIFVSAKMGLSPFGAHQAACAPENAAAFSSLGRRSASVSVKSVGNNRARHSGRRPAVRPAQGDALGTRCDNPLPLRANGPILCQNGWPAGPADGRNRPPSPGRCPRCCTHVHKSLRSFYARFTLLLRSFTSVSAAGGIRPGIHAGLSNAKWLNWCSTPIHGRSRYSGFNHS